MIFVVLGMYFPNLDLGGSNSKIKKSLKINGAREGLIKEDFFEVEMISQKNSKD